MKHLALYIFIIVSSLFAVSCNNNLPGKEEGEMCNVTINMSTENVTKSGETLHYVVQVFYKGKSIYRTESKDSNINLTLPNGTFDLCFWADYGAYDVDDLTNVTRGDNFNPYNGDCFAVHKEETINSDFTVEARLERVVAKIEYENLLGSGVTNAAANAVYSDNIATSYNVLSGTINNISENTALVSPLNFDDNKAVDYLFVNPPEGSDRQSIVIKISVNPSSGSATAGDNNAQENGTETSAEGNTAEETPAREFTIPNVEIQQNKITRISGTFF